MLQAHGYLYNDLEQDTEGIQLFCYLCPPSSSYDIAPYDWIPVLKCYHVICEFRYNDNRRSGPGPYTYIQALGFGAVPRLQLSTFFEYKGSLRKCVSLSRDLQQCAG